MFHLADAPRAAYHAGEDDETMDPLVHVDATGWPIGRVRHGDYVVFYDIRGARTPPVRCSGDPVLPQGD